MDKLKEILIGLGVVASVATGLTLYINNQKSIITWEEYQGIIKAYDQTVQNIKRNCKTDMRCIEKNNKQYINFGKIGSKDELVQKLNQWLIDGDLVYKKVVEVNN